jgi:membrane associated rhomboid family serine protease
MSSSIILVFITCAVSILAFNKPEYLLKLRFNAYEIQHKRQAYRFFTYGLVHADALHLFVNMYVLYNFGPWVEFFFNQYFQEKGTLFFVLLYISSLFASVIPSFEKHKNHGYYNAVGASGAISAIVFASILFDPLAPMGLLFLPFHFPAVMFGIAYLIYSYYMAKKGNDSIGHDAHFFGALFGIMFTILLNKNIAINFYYQLLEWFSR